MPAVLSKGFHLAHRISMAQAHTCFFNTTMNRSRSVKLPSAAIQRICFVEITHEQNGIMAQATYHPDTAC